MCLVALPSGAVKPTRTLALLRRPLVVRPPSWPFFSASLQCQACLTAAAFSDRPPFALRHFRGRAVTIDYLTTGANNTVG